MSPNTNMLHRLAERAASHPRIESAVLGAIRIELPSVIEQLLREMADADGGTLRVYMAKRPPDQRAQRDERVLALMEAGTDPKVAAKLCGCSRSHAFSVRARSQQSKTRP